MAWLTDTALAAFGFAVLLTPVHLVVFFVQRHRTRSSADAARFVGVGVATVVGFVVALAGLGALLGALDAGPPSDCERLGGEPVAIQGTERPGVICVVN